MICISVTPASRTFAKVDLLNAARQCDLVELCLDRLIKEPDVGDLLEGIDKPILISCRTTRDGGQFEGTDEQRMTILRQAIVANPAYIELDYETAQAIPRFGNVKRVIAYTGLKKPFSKEDIEDIFTEAKQLDADVVKFTWPTPTLEAAWPLLSAVSKKRELQAVGLGLGRAGMTFSLLGRKYGSPWIYAALEKGMEAYDDQATVGELDETYQWREINDKTTFIGGVGLGKSETVTSQCMNSVFKSQGLNVRCLPLMSEKFDRLKQMLGSLKINAVVTSADLGDDMVALADELEESAKLSQYADLLLNKGSGFMAYNSLWRSAVKTLEGTLSGTGNDKRPLDKQNVLVIGAGSLAKAMIYGAAKRKGLVSVTAPNDKAATALAAEFDVRFVPFGNIYNTLSDVVVIADPQLEVGGGKTEFNPSYLIPRMTVCDVTEMPFDSIYVKQARERGAKVVEPKSIYMNQMSALVKSITGKTVETSDFESIVDAALE
ncbi:MAG: type I 3-dehydroquinate dehydratase [Planctomycetes bacterium]|nr:type I 3-dehydroquinate dehydratase [Planctomycetota bacterium]